MYWICCKCGDLTDDGVPSRQLCMFCADNEKQDVEMLNAEFFYWPDDVDDE